MDKEPLPTIPLLIGVNYLVWAMKMEAFLSLKGLDRALYETTPGETEMEKLRTEWETRNKNAVAYIRLHLSGDQALQFATVTSAQKLWCAIKRAYAGAAEDQKIDTSNDLKFLRMEDKESVADYIARACGLGTKCISLGVEISARELAYYTLRGINDNYKDLREILKTQRDRSIEEIQEILKECEKERKRREGVVDEEQSA